MNIFDTCKKELLIFVMVLLILFIIMAYVNKVIKRRHQPQINFDTLLEILLSMVSVELDLYEREIFNDRTGLTNANFTNFMQDICGAIESHISPEFMQMITVYVTEDFVYTLITKKVKAYLVSKVA